MEGQVWGCRTQQEAQRQLQDWHLKAWPQGRRQNKSKGDTELYGCVVQLYLLLIGLQSLIKCWIMLIMLSLKMQPNLASHFGLLHSHNMGKIKISSTCRQWVLVIWKFHSFGPPRWWMTFDKRHICDQDYLAWRVRVTELAAWAGSPFPAVQPDASRSISQTSISWSV